MVNPPGSSGRPYIIGCAAPDAVQDAHPKTGTHVRPGAAVVMKHRILVAYGMDVIRCCSPDGKKVFGSTTGHLCPGATIPVNYQSFEPDHEDIVCRTSPDGI